MSLNNGPERGSDIEVTGQLVPCPRCERATGVPLPRRSTRVDDTDAADGTSPTVCPRCNTQFEVHYALDEAR